MSDIVELELHFAERQPVEPGLGVQIYWSLDNIN
jgi:hypothetical protein